MENRSRVYRTFPAAWTNGCGRPYVCSTVLVSRCQAAGAPLQTFFVASIPVVTMGADTPTHAHSHMLYPGLVRGQGLGPFDLQNTQDVPVSPTTLPWPREGLVW